MSERKRCSWSTHHELEQQYHDLEWGKPNHDERYLFQMICLEGMQAGLAWLLILKKREAYQQAYYNFDINKVAAMSNEELENLLADEQCVIIKNRNKVFSVRSNAQAFIKIQEEFGSFDTYIWQFVDGVQIVNKWQDETQLPASSPLSELISKDLKKRGFKFVGPVIIYSYLQAIGIINDHIESCDFI